MEENIKSLIGNKIRQFRKAKGYTLTQFSQMLHKSKSSISKYEHGEVSIDIDTLNDIAQVLSVPLSQLIDIKEQKTPRVFKSAALPLLQKELLYVYFWDGRTKRHLRRNVLAMGEDTAALYADIADYTNYTQCNYYYYGEIQRLDASVRAFLVNPANERDLVLINFADPLNYQSIFYGFFSSLSVGMYHPFSTKCVLSANILTDENSLKQMLIMSKQEIKDFKRLNMFRVVSPNSLA